MKHENARTSEVTGNGHEGRGPATPDHGERLWERREPLATTTELNFGLGAIGVVWLGVE